MWIVVNIDVGVGCSVQTGLQGGVVGGGGAGGQAGAGVVRGEAGLAGAHPGLAGGVGNTPAVGSTPHHPGLTPICTVHCQYAVHFTQ